MQASILLKGYFDDKGMLTHFPGKKKKKKVMLLLEYLAEKFERGKTYTEKEVNQILNQFHSFNDPAILRRLLFVRRFIHRTKDGRTYWRD